MFNTNARQKADRIAATVGVLAFAAGLTTIVWGAVTPETTVAGD